MLGDALSIAVFGLRRHCLLSPLSSSSFSSAGGSPHVRLLSTFISPNQHRHHTTT
jgi:hypothetical protein